MFECECVPGKKILRRYYLNVNIIILGDFGSKQKFIEDIEFTGILSPIKVSLQHIITKIYF